MANRVVNVGGNFMFEHENRKIEIVQVTVGPGSCILYTNPIVASKSGVRASRTTKQVENLTSERDLKRLPR